MTTVTGRLSKPIACPKPSRFARQAEEKKQGRVTAKDRAIARNTIYRLDGGRCRKCGKKVYLKLKDAPHESQVGHVDEVQPRSLSGSILDITNLILFCAECHLHGKHGKVFDIILRDPKRGTRGPVDFPPHVPKAGPR